MATDSYLNAYTASTLGDYGISDGAATLGNLDELMRRDIDSLEGDMEGSAGEMAWDMDSDLDNQSDVSLHYTFLRRSGTRKICQYAGPGVLACKTLDGVLGVRSLNQLNIATFVHQMDVVCVSHLVYKSSNISFIGTKNI